MATATSPDRIGSDLRSSSNAGVGTRSAASTTNGASPTILLIADTGWPSPPTANRRVRQSPGSLVADSLEDVPPDLVGSMIHHDRNVLEAGPGHPATTRSMTLMPATLTSGSNVA